MENPSTALPSPTSPEPSATLPAIEPVKPSATLPVPTPTSQLAQTPTLASSATLESTPTATPTAEPVWVRSLEGATVYEAPGAEYPALAFYTEGITLTIVGQDTTGGWLVAAISPYNTGWIASEDVTQADGLQALPLVEAPAGVATATPAPEVPLSVSTEIKDRTDSMNWERPAAFLRISVRAAPGARVFVEVTAPDGKTVFKDIGRTDYTGSYITNFYGGLKQGGSYVITARDEAGNSDSVTISIDRKVNPN
jgi:hypothetical protein